MPAEARVIAVVLLTAAPDEVATFYAELFGWSPVETATATATVPGTFHSRWAPVLATDDPRRMSERLTDEGWAVLLELPVGLVITDPGGATSLLVESGASVPGLDYAPGSRIGGQPSWVQLNSDAPEAASAWLRSGLGWQVGNSENERFTYWRLLVDGEHHGGMMAVDERSGRDIRPSWQVYFHSDALGEHTRRLLERGGGVVVPETEIAAGRFVVARDPGGAVFALDDMRHDHGLGEGR